MKIGLILLSAGIFIFCGCNSHTTSEVQVKYGDELNFLKQHVSTIELSSPDGRARIAVVPGWQGRVMSSTAEGLNGTSFGWINRKLIASGQKQPHIHVWGGEDRFWMGPEGGQYAIFFEPGVPFEFENWFVPPQIDTEAFDLQEQDRDRISFKKEMRLRNYSGYEFQLTVQRVVQLEALDVFLQKYGLSRTEGLSAVAFSSQNRITNSGPAAWKKESGLLSIWILGMFQPSPETTVIIPFHQHPGVAAGFLVNTDYFGPVSDDRLQVRDGLVYFKGDGQYRCKIGLPAEYSRPVMGSFDSARNILTIVEYTLPENAAQLPYVNSMWKLHEDPYNGDVVNSYNDGPAQPGAEPLGPFYELESSSPALELQPGESVDHTQRTLHFTGPRAALKPIARIVLGVDLDEVAGVFGNK